MLWQRIYFIIIIITIFFYCEINGLSKCLLKIPKDGALRPDVKVNFGTKQIILPSYRNSIRMKQNDQISIYCSNGFATPQAYGKQINIICTDDDMYCSQCLNKHLKSNSYSYERIVEMEVRCSFNSEVSAWSLFEIGPEFTFCLNNEISYALGKVKFSSTKIVYGICYNIDQMKLGSISYAIGSEIESDIFKNFNVSVEINDALDYFEKPNNFTMTDNELIHWTKIAGQYENKFLVSDDGIEAFGFLPHVPFWRNLHSGNWHRYQTALRERSKIQPYKRITGISGRLEVPIENKCNHNIKMQLSTDPIPLYIWDYIESLAKDVKEKYLIIGINSPFYDFYENHDLVLCNDKCTEIDWLNGVSSTFRYSVMGIVFCCALDDLNQSNSTSDLTQIINRIVKI